jgi:hypothetical protein
VEHVATTRIHYPPPRFRVPSQQPTLREGKRIDLSLPLQESQAELTLPKAEAKRERLSCGSEMGKPVNDLQGPRGAGQGAG